MGGGFVPPAGGGRAAKYQGGVTWYVLFTAIVASSGGAHAAGWVGRWRVRVSIATSWLGAAQASLPYSHLPESTSPMPINVPTSLPALPTPFGRLALWIRSGALSSTVCGFHKTEDRGTESAAHAV